MDVVPGLDKSTLIMPFPPAPSISDRAIEKSGDQDQDWIVSEDVISLFQFLSCNAANGLGAETDHRR